MLTMMKLSGDVNDLAAYHCGEENYYYSQAGDVERILSDSDIKAQGQESLEYVKVYGELCEKFYLEQGSNISEATFANLLRGNDPHGTKRVRQHKVHGYDLTFSAPKTVSIAGLVTDKDPEIIKAHDQAILDVMKEIEQLHAYAQPTAGKHIKTGKLLFTTVRDGFSREHDPHLHTHVVLMNLTEHDDKIMALSAKEIMTPDFNKTWGAVYRAKLAARLKDLGYGITYTKAGEWRLDKISYAAELMFSTRRRQILEAEAQGSNDMDAWRKTRSEKNPFIDKAEITREWQRQYKEYEAEREDKIRAATLADRERWASKAVFSVEAYQEINHKRDNTTENEKWQLAARRATEKSAAVSRQGLICEYLSECMRDGAIENISFQEASCRLDSQVDAGNLVKIDNNRFTSWEMIIADRQYMNIAGKTLSTGPIFEKDNVKSFLEAFQASNKVQGGRTLSDIQIKAAMVLLASDSRLCVVQGDAGAGKTATLRGVAEFYKAQGVETVGLAMQGVAANNLQEETGVNAFTVSSFLARTAEKKGRVIIVDEASMIDSRTAARLFSAAEENNDKVILVGDVNQIESIAAGRVFERLVEDYGHAGELVTLNENYRQKDEGLKEAVDFARKGLMGESLETLEARGDVLEIEDAAQRRAAIAKLYDRDTLIITTTQAARDELNALIRERLTADVILEEKKAATFTVRRQDQEGVEHDRKIVLAPNDVITFCKNEYRLYDVRNGERATVLNIQDDTITVKLQDTRTIEIDLRKYKNIDYGYALTTFKAQGQTYSKVIVDSDTSIPSLNDMRNVYVNITRARDDVKIFSDDKEFLKELAEIKTHAADTLSRSDILLSHAREQEARLLGFHTPQKDIPGQNRQKETGFTRDI